MSAIDEVKQRLDIVDVVSGYVALTKAGRNFKAHCPFHEEKTPSFFVFPERQTWRCFGCGEGGDLVSFVMKKEGMDFSEALKLLVDRAGVSLVRKKRTDEDRLSERLYRLNEEAAKFYHDTLLSDPAAEPARRYVNGRGLDPTSIDNFYLGFSKAEGLKKHLMDKGFSEKELLTAGLVGEKDGRTFDYFRNRLMFPIKDIKGRTVGFGARALDKSLPKYLNSPQSALFDKSGILYGIDRAKGAIRERGAAVIVEGYMDVITAHQHDITNVVASMGTALTEKQVKILRGLTKELIFALDPDAAGNTATMRGIDVARRSLNREGLEMPSLLGATSRLKADIRIMPLPEGKDPDALIREDPQEWQRRVGRALTLMDYLIEVITARVDLTRAEGRSEAIEQLLPLIAEIEDETQRELYTGKMAKLLNINDRTLLGQVATLIRTRKEKSGRAPSRPSSATRSGDTLEEYCLALLLQHPELRDKADTLLPDHFERSENRELFIAWADASGIDELRQSVNVDLQEHLEILMGKTLPPGDDLVWEKALVDCIGRLEERRLRLQEQFLTFENVPQVSAGDLDATRLAIVQQSTVEVDAQLTKKMRERTG